MGGSTLVLLLMLAAFAAGAAPTSGAPAKPNYGKELAKVADLGIGPAMDVAVVRRYAYVVGQRTLHVADIADPDHPRVVGKLDDLGSVRQIIIDRDVAYISSREDGLYVVSVRNPAAPKLLCRYDTVEWATGLAVTGDILCIACRSFGVELVDISQPQRPRHISTVRTGEAQSVVARRGSLYTGVWGTSEVVVTDIRSPRDPKIVARLPLDGYGDGVDVRGNYLYAATGHHSRERHAVPDDPGYGRGHGLEIFDIQDPARPAFVSRIKFPRFYGLGNDMWSVTVAGDYAFVADTHNGMFVVDIRDPKNPTCVARHTLPPARPGRPEPGFVGGLALMPDRILVAGGASDLHVLAAPGLAVPPTREPDTPPVLAPLPSGSPIGKNHYLPDGQVYAAAVRGDTLFVACGAAGLHVLRRGLAFERLQSVPTLGFATDVAVNGDRIYVAEGSGGLSVWSAADSGTLRLLGRYRVEGQPVRHVAVPGPGRYALVQVGGNRLHIVDVSDPAASKLALADTQLGLLYGNQIMDGLIGGRYAAVFWHVSGLHWYDLYGGEKPAYVAAPRPTGSFSPQDSVAVFGENALATRRGGLVVFGRDESRPLDQLTTIRLPGLSLHGKPVIAGNRLYVTNRASGAVTILDIADAEHPKVVETFTTSGNPGRIVDLPSGYIIPDGYSGLLFYNHKRDSTGASGKLP